MALPTKEESRQPMLRISNQSCKKQEREKHCKYFIIHGPAKKYTNTGEINRNDLFFQQINNNARPTKYYRLGKLESNRDRPLNWKWQATWIEMP